MNVFKLPTSVYFDKNALDKLCEYKGLNAVIITDRFMVKTGAADMIASKLSKCTSVSIFDDVSPNPPIELIVQGVDFLSVNKADIIVALGGGSSIDAAKAILLMAKRTGVIKNASLIAIPTTSGTGSEVTQFSVISDLQAGVKYPLVNEELQPDIAILDPNLVLTAPPNITADTGFDVITHALEAYISTDANDFSDALAEKAIDLAFDYLPLAYANGEDLIARDKMHKASCLAGMAFNIVSLGVNHGIAHALSAKFYIPHGRANAILLPHVMLYNSNLPSQYVAEEEYSITAIKLEKVARIIGIRSSNVKHAVTTLCSRITSLAQMCEIPTTLGEAGVTREEYLANKESIISSALDDACTATNPRAMTRESIEEILSNIAKF